MQFFFSTVVYLLLAVQQYDLMAVAAPIAADSNNQINNNADAPVQGITRAPPLTAVAGANEAPVTAAQKQNFFKNLKSKIGEVGGKGKAGLAKGETGASKKMGKGGKAGWAVAGLAGAAYAGDKLLHHERHKGASEYAASISSVAATATASTGSKPSAAVTESSGPVGATAAASADTSSPGFTGATIETQAPGVASAVTAAASAGSNWY